ncbi:protein-L-isoaspartate(D-aspartate) O-methyltransferase [candidate division NPL-UPA2 bacterium Unc8]|uniref:Protein-L-isoaspartate O-methyltransferase n=1 Tax=candidate division NPL-UPA2 bacterium Unc8 TaxID=1980939 RepID=A0A399FVX0_UNCN2|nr:Protein-L-isoaspartate O-methyltransferase [Bacillota bacterium]RII00568.1 MAG: protein-L-isoaspartate(D-aspartate) O-methyltransferase [candidate division NPL-UPA2 bacterium Unc8]
MSFEKERRDMVALQIKGRGIVDARVLEAMKKVERHRFVEKKLESSAYTDSPLPIAARQTISQPYIVALMTEYLRLEGREKVLEIGTGSGYQAAILAELAREVYSIERIEELSLHAAKLLGELGYRNIHFKVGDGTNGWSEHSPYDRIIVTAGAVDIPPFLVEQLGGEGKIVIPIGARFSQELVLLTKKEGKIRKEKKGSCIFVPLVGEYG